MSSPPSALLELLPLYAADVLDDDELAEVERGLAEHPALRREVERWREAFASIALSEEPAAIDPRERVRLLASLGAPGAAIGRFAAEVAALFDVSIEAARTALARADDAAAWQALLPGIECLTVLAGPKFADRMCNLVRIAPGTSFPRHRHVGEEVSLVLHGGAHMSDGRDLRPGDILTVGPETEHDFTIDAAGDPCIFAVRSAGLVPVMRSS